jgi:hypothetical protein
MDCLISSCPGRSIGNTKHHHGPQNLLLFSTVKCLWLWFSSETKKWPHLWMARHLEASLLNLVVYTVVIQRSITQTETLWRPCFFHYVDCMRRLNATQDGQETFTQSNTTTVNNSEPLIRGHVYHVRKWNERLSFKVPYWHPEVSRKFCNKIFICARPQRVTDCCTNKFLWTWTVKGNVIIPVQTKTTTLSIVDRAYIKEVGQRAFYILLD